MELLKTIFSLLKAFPSTEASIVLTDKTKYIYYQPSSQINLNIKVGEPIREGSVSAQALREKQVVSRYMDDSIFGVPYYSLSIPHVKEDKVYGCIALVFPDHFKEKKATYTQHEFLVGKTEDRYFPIPFKDIHYIHSEGGKTYLHTPIGTFQNKYSLTELNSILPDIFFIQCHRSYIINIHFIKEIQPNFHSTFLLILNDQNKSRIPVSQKYASFFRHRLGF